jgi:O-antigen/teichoic acid export membrane protein
MKYLFKKQLKIKIWILISLLLGFFVTILIPRMSISKIGVNAYGLYALVLGYVPILAMADIGMLPGITRQFAKFIAEKNFVEIKKLFNRANKIILIATVGAALICILSIIYFSDKLTLDLGLSLLLLVGVSYFSIQFDLKLALVRSKGDIELSYAYRISYSVIYLMVFGLLYFFIPVWPGIFVIVFCQFFAVVLLCFILQRQVIRPIYLCCANDLNDSISKVKNNEVWREIWQTSSAELLNRIVQFFVAVVERPLLLIYGGLVLVGSMDLLTRLMLIVSAIPGALNQPLLAMLSHDAARNPADAKFPHALRLTKVVSASSAGLGVVLSLILFVFFHENIFGINSILPVYMACIMAFASGVNVLTASGSAALLSSGIVWPCNMKSLIEAIGIVLGIIVAIANKDAIIFLVFRYGFLLISALCFLIFEKIVWKNKYD